jgi:microcin C transport system permease protein
VLARLFYGYRIVMTFAIAFTVLIYIIGTIIGCAMGYFAGLFDLLGQRLVEIVSVIPFLYIVIIAVSLIPGDVENFDKIVILLLIMVAFSWTGLTYYMRTSTYKEKERDYVSAARVMGAGNWRVVTRHILPNTISVMVTFLPFTVAGAIASLTALDFLGFGLPAPTPSWGQMLEAGLKSLYSPWIVTSAFCALAFVLILVTFVGEAVREAFDPKKYTVYR